MALLGKFEETCASLKAVVENHRGAQFSAELGDALNALLASAEEQGEGASRRVSDAVAGIMMETSSPTGAGCLAIWLGAGVENGVDPEPSCEPILETLLKWTRTLVTPPEDEDGETAEEEGDLPEPPAETLAGLELMGMALVAHLSRAPGKRAWAAGNSEVLEELGRVEGLSAAAAWALQLLNQRSGDLLAFDVSGRKGFLVHYENIANCFHLFTLLQGALAGLAPSARTADERVLEIARGASSGECHDCAWWHYGQGDVFKADIAASVWGEMGPGGIVSVDGVQTLLLWPPILQSRSWDAGFFSPILHACLPGATVTRELSDAENDVWCKRLGLVGQGARG